MAAVVVVLVEVVVIIDLPIGKSASKSRVSI
jgi:hypothetical protein